mmetsp:Transcript_20841/g.39752  ORF Transcript_20841/g.39752 Transcript_20841/m.39752 type:complete len:107 (+) Transcript_20841:264-584(+)
MQGLAARKLIMVVIHRQANQLALRRSAGCKEDENRGPDEGTPSPAHHCAVSHNERRAPDESWLASMVRRGSKSRAPNERTEHTGSCPPISQARKNSLFKTVVGLTT